jgi:multiple sugar transport system substrate-binding protein
MREKRDKKSQLTATRPLGAPRGGWSRRDFLKAAGVTVGGVVGGPILAACSTSSGTSSSGPAQITFTSARFYGRSNMSQIVDAYNKSQTKVRVTYQELPPPSSSTEVHQTLVQQLARKDGTPDAFTQDVIWIAEFAGAGWAAPLDSYFTASDRAAYFPGMIQACTWQGKLTALPWFVDAGMLYYRTDLLQAMGVQAPRTWAELARTAEATMSQHKANFGFLWQGKQAEVLVCDAVEYIASNNGSILKPDGRTVSIADPPAVEAVQYMHDTIQQTKISPADVLSWDEEPSRRPFTSGQAALLRNWSYVWADAQDPGGSSVVGKVGVVPLPSFDGGKSAACLGGYQYGVNASSKNKDATVDFLRWMSHPAQQLRFATEVGLAPSKASVYDDPALAKANPFMQSLKSVFVGATPRPVTPKYPQVTLVLQSQLSKALTQGDVKGALQSAKSQIETIVKG